MRKLYFVLPALGLAALLALASCVPGTGQSPYQQPYQYGPGGMGGGMMGGGMMGGQGGMMGGGMMGGQGGMMGGQGQYNPYYQNNPSAKPITIDQAADAVRLYVNQYGGTLVLSEIMEFANHFYAEVEEKDTGIHAMELIIDRYTGQVSPEMGPNVMWNSKYGMMTGSYSRGSTTTAMTVNPEQARTFAQQFLAANLPGLTVSDADAFYGYYTLHTLRDGKVEGMLSVNGYTGAVWYHTWHGPFITQKEYS